MAAAYDSGRVVSGFEFRLEAEDSTCGARCGRLELPHGPVETPVFMPVGTQASVKGMTPRDLRECGTEILLANTYHLALRPGSDLVRRAGGLHAFMGWDRPILTDSGGYQVYSLSTLNRIDDDGVTFRSHVDGELLRLTPERSVEIQNDLGADIIMAFDECPPYDAPRREVERAVERTSRWAQRSLAAHRRPAEQALFGIVQGGRFDDLRLQSSAELKSLDFAGYAIGGVSVGETPEAMRRVVAVTAPQLPRERPRYLMGVGTPDDLVDMVALGVDLFDCVMPTRHARNASLFGATGSLNLRNQRFADDFSPVLPGCRCYTCKHVTRAYLRHLYGRGEMLAPILGTLHNLTYYHDLIERMRAAIRGGTFGDFCRLWRQERSRGES